MPHPTAPTDSIAGAGRTLSVREALERGVDVLRSRHDTARLDAEVLLAHALRAPRHRPYAFAEEPMSDAAARTYEALVERRATGEPVAYLTGTREFWSLALEVTPATLIPRPETEGVVAAALALVPPRARWRIADLGTGSGAIAIAIACERPHCQVVATDVSAAALEVARRNAARHRLERIEFRHGSWWEPIGGERYDLIACNPPYVASADPHLGRGDLRFEPAIALAAGDDGLEAVRAIASEARRFLRPGARLVLEHGLDQGAAVADLLRARGARDIAHHRDLAGHERVVEAAW